LQSLQLLAEQPLQSPLPAEETNFPARFVPKSENLRSTFRERHEGQETLLLEEERIFSNSSPHLAQ
jgi:hypothetical protein